MSDATKPVACGWCGHGNTEVHDDYLLADDGETPVHQVICLGCGAAGCLCESTEAAITAWNRMWAAREPGPATRKIVEIMASGWTPAGLAAPRAEGVKAGYRFSGGWIYTQDITAALAELGMSPGDGKGVGE